MNCQYCGNDIPAGNNICPSCGAAAPQPPQQNAVPPQNNFQSCGAAAPQQNAVPLQNNFQPGVNIPANYPQKERIVYILLGLFLGCLGIHNFYAGYSAKGAAQLLITLLLGWLVIPWIAVCIWCLIEICTVTQDANSIRMK